MAKIHTHADPSVRSERLAYFRSLPVVAYVRSDWGPDTGFGNIVDVLAAEATALATDAADTVAIADAARPNVFAYGPGREVMRPFDDAEPVVGEWMMAPRERARRIVAISQADVRKAPNVTLKELLRMPPRAPTELEASLLRYAARMMSEVVERGDPGIDDPVEVAAGFTASVRDAMRQLGETGAHPVVALLGWMGLRPEDFRENATVEDLQRIAFRRPRASIAARGIGVDLTVIAARVCAERFPSAVIGDGLAHFGQQPRRR